MLQVLPGLLTALLYGALVYTAGRSWWPSPRRPAVFLQRKRPPGRVVACAGASATQGNVSWDWVAELERRLPGTTFVNAAVGGWRAVHVRRAIGRVVACAPDDVVVMVGVNDVGARTPVGRYRAELERIVDAIHEGSDARIAMLTLTVVGDDPECARAVAQEPYIDAVRAVCRDRGVACLDIAAEQRQWLRAQGRRPGVLAWLGFPLVFLAMVERWVLRLDYDTVTRLHGFLLTTDLIHQNSVGGRQIADLVEGWLAQTAPDRSFDPSKRKPRHKGATDT